MADTSTNQTRSNITTMYGKSNENGEYSKFTWLNGAGTPLNEKNLNQIERKLDTIVNKIDKEIIGRINDHEKDISGDTGINSKLEKIEKDYLKTSDKTELTDAIDAKVSTSAYDKKITALEKADTDMDSRIRTLEEMDHTKYAQSSDLTILAERVTTAEGEIDTLQSDITTLNTDKANKSDVYTKEDVNNLINEIPTGGGTTVVSLKWQSFPTSST